MVKFNDNTWYHVTANISSTLALYGPGSLFFSTKDPMDLGQQWQIFLNNEIYYVLRNNQLGPTEVISTFGNSEGGAPAMSSIPDADLSMYWAIIPWRDGTYYMTNPANGSNWHLNVVADNTTNLLIDISSNITAPQNGQRFTFSSISLINDKAFSTAETSPGTVLAFSASAASTSTSSFTASSTSLPSVISSGIIKPSGTTLASNNSSLSSPTSSSSSSASSHESSLSPVISAVIGASVAVAVLLAAILAVLLFLHRRKGKASLGQTPQADEDVKPYGSASKRTNSLNPQTQQYEMEEKNAWEMEGHI